MVHCLYRTINWHYHALLTRLMLNHRQYTFRIIQNRINRIITVALQLGKREKKDKLQIKEEDDCVQKHPVGGSAGRIADGRGRPHYSDTDPGSAKSGSACPGCRYRSGKIMRIPPDPDPQHWNIIFNVPHCSSNIQRQLYQGYPHVLLNIFSSP